MVASTAARTHGRWLWRLLALFAARVVAQPLAGVTGWRGVPPFETWQSGALPYAWLLVSQVTLLALMARAAARVSSGSERPDAGRGRVVLAIAAGYGTVMAGRLVLGATAYHGHWWLDAPLPTLFHLVLTTFLVVYGHYHWRAHPLDAPSS